jgi:hypothetical protein
MIEYFNPATDPKINFLKMTDESLGMLEKAREIAGVPFVVSSSYRTPEHSIEVGGLNNDAHTEDLCSAYDIKYSDHSVRAKILYGLVMAGFRRIGVNKINHHIHVDNSTKLPKPAFWLEGEDDA